MKKYIIYLIVTVGVLFGQNTGYSDAFMNIGASSRSVGLGQSVVALPMNIGGYVVNPSATAFIKQNTFNGMYVNQFELAEYFAFGFTHPTKRGFQLGLHGVNLKVSDIFERPDVQNITDLEARRDAIRALVAEGFNTFGTRESALFFNIAKNIETTIDPGWRFAEIPLKIPVGINIKLIQKDLYQVKGQGIGVDLGGMMMWDMENLFLFDWLDEIALGLSLNNIVNTTIYWNSGEKDYIPMQLVGGIGYFQTFDNLPIKYNLLFQQNSIYRGKSQAGAELILFDLINIRGGYNYGYLQGGIGLKFGNLNYTVGLDYSFSDHDLGDAHRLGGWISF